MSRVYKRLYSRDKISSRFKLLIHKLLPVRRKVISGATAAACMLMVVAGVVAFDRTFGDFLSGRDFSGLASGQQSSDDQDLLLEQQPDGEQPDLESGHQPVDDYSDPTFGNQSGGPSANGDQTTDRYPAIAPNNGYISTEKDIAAPHHLPINRTYGHTDCYTINIPQQIHQETDRPDQCLVLCCERQIGHMGKRTRFWRLPYLETIGREA